jgi:outer membrane receptor protein involved in Fe transport
VVWYFSFQANGRYDQVAKNAMDTGSKPPPTPTTTTTTGGGSGSCAGVAAWSPTVGVCLFRFSSMSAVM